MLGTIICSVIFFILHGLVVIGGTWQRVPMYERPTAYQSQFIQGILGLASIIHIIFSIVFLIFVSWKLYIVLFMVGTFLGKIVLYPLVEWIIIVPIIKWASKER